MEIDVKQAGAPFCVIHNSQDIYFSGFYSCSFFLIINKPGLPLSKVNLATLQLLNNKLTEEKQDIKEDITSRSEKLQSLYSCLGMTPREEFINFNRFTKVWHAILISLDWFKLFYCLYYYY